MSALTATALAAFANDWHLSADAAARMVADMSPEMRSALASRYNPAADLEVQQMLLDGASMRMALRRVQMAGYSAESIRKFSTFARDDELPQQAADEDDDHSECCGEFTEPEASRRARANYRKDHAR